ncbi:MAG: Omp28-related outer membrane protein [Bacteroidia bacterium]
MKKTMLYLAAAGFMFASCQKDEETTATNGVGAKASTTSSVSPLPGSFTKKVLIEELTGQNEGTAPYADRFFDSYVLNTAGGKICVASLYNSGQLTNLETNRLISTLSPGTASLPCGVIDRVPRNGSMFVRPTSMSQAVTSSLATPVSCGLAMTSTISGRMATINVHTGFLANMTSSYRVNVYLIEDVVSSSSPIFAQANSYNSTVGSPYYNLGNPILNYVHRNVVRKVVSPTGGDPILPANTVAGGTQVFTYQVDLNQKVTTGSKFYVISFITDNLTSEVLNVQMGQLGGLTDWN